MLNTISLLATLASIAGASTDAKAPFNPRQYPLSTVSCRTWDRSGKEPTATNIDISYAEINPKAEKTLVLVHGWPSLWSTWSNQIQHFENDYHLLVPNLRGFGQSGHPGDVQTSGPIDDMVGDIICMMDQAGVEKGTCVGHDWGAQICWEAARRRPDRFHAVAGAVVPYLHAAGPFTPMEHLVKALPRLAYQIFFEKQTAEAIKELNEDIRRTLRGILRNVESPPPDHFLASTKTLMGGWNDHAEIPPIPFMSREEEDYMVEQYSIQGFDKTIQFYMHPNRFHTHISAASQGNFTIPHPALFLVPNMDPVANWTLAAHLLKSAHFIPKLTTAEIDHSAHWPQLEQPDAFNRELTTWLKGVEEKYDTRKKARDEL